MPDMPDDPFINDQGIPSYILPYEEIPENFNPGGLEVLGNDQIAVGHCDFKTMVIDTPLGIFPLLQLSFRDAAGRPLMPITLLLDIEHLQAFKEQLTLAINDAIRKAKSRGA